MGASDTALGAEESKRQEIYIKVKENRVVGAFSYFYVLCIIYTSVNLYAYHIKNKLLSKIIVLLVLVGMVVVSWLSSETSTKLYYYAW